MNVHGRPTAAELVAAVAEFLDTEVRDATQGQVSYHTRVAANALRMVQRELEDADVTTVQAALRTLGVEDEPALAAAIRRGEWDHSDAVLPVLRVLAGNRLSVANPGYRTDR